MKSEIQHFRQIGTDAGMVEPTISGYQIGFDFNQLLWSLVIPIFIFASATGFIVANSIAGVLADLPDCTYTVSALTGPVHYGSGIAGSGLVGTLADGTPWPMEGEILISEICFLLSMSLLSR